LDVNGCEERLYIDSVGHHCWTVCSLLKFRKGFVPTPETLFSCWNLLMVALTITILATAFPETKKRSGLLRHEGFSASSRWPDDLAGMRLGARDDDRRWDAQSARLPNTFITSPSSVDTLDRTQEDKYMPSWNLRPSKHDRGFCEDGRPSGAF
jgi:hypothetical protein